jgi:putative peptidoglycan lipid II flippase
MSLLRSVATVGGYTMISRVLGFMRDILMATAIGAGPVADAFFVAFRIPNMFRRLVAEGAFSAAFVPMFARRLEAEGKAVALEFASHSLSILVGFLLVFSALFMIFMPFMMQFLAPGFALESNKFALAVEFTRITFPYLTAMAIVALLGGVLTAFYKFAAMAAAPILLNIILIGCLLFAMGQSDREVGNLLSWCVAAAGVAQVIFLIVACARQDIHIKIGRPRLNKDVKRLLKLMLPGALGAGVMQINILVGTIIASFLATGSISYLYYADRVYQLPLGVIGIAVGTALLPLLSRQIRAGEEQIAIGSLNRAIELSFLLTLPAAVALMVIPREITLVLFQHGEFSVAASDATAAALLAFSSGLPAYVLVKILAPAFFAREDTTTPVVVGVIAMAANVLLSLLLIQSFAHVGIAIATSLSSWLNALIMLGLLIKRGHYQSDTRLLRRSSGMIIASAVMGIGLWFSAGFLQAELVGDLMSRIIALGLIIVCGGGVYFVCTLVTGAARLADLKAMLQRRSDR